MPETGDSNTQSFGPSQGLLMARIRTIKPDFWTDDVVADLDPIAMLLYIGMWNFTDDEGYIKDSVGQLRRQIFPDRGFDVSAALDQLVDRGRVLRMDSDQGRVLYLPHLLEHQKISHPTPSKFTNVRPLGAPSPEDSGTLRSPLEPSALKEGKEGMGKEGKGAAPESSGAPPLPRCPLHLNSTNPPKCGPCKDARLAYETWQREQGATVHPIVRKPPKYDPAVYCEHLGLLGDCSLCDAEAKRAASVLGDRFGA